MDASNMYAEAAKPAKKSVLLRCGPSPLRKVCWYDPSPALSLESLFRAACGLSADQQFLLTDAECCPVAVTSSLPSGQTFELVPLPMLSLPNALTPVAVVVVDPISTGAVVLTLHNTTTSLPQLICLS